MATRTWYRIAISRPDGRPLLVAAEGEHLGVAVDAAERHVKGAIAIAAELAAADQIPLGESVGKERVVEVGEAIGVTAFHWPSGVVPRLGHELAVKRGFAIRDDPKLLVIEAQTDREHLVDLFLGLIERVPAADNLEVRVLDHYDSGAATNVWLTSRIDAKRVIRFLDEHDDLIENGHLELSVYVRKHAATLRLTEHKTVVWIADDNTLRDDVIGWLRDLSMLRVEELVTVTDAPHFHYRPAKSRERPKLEDYLYRQRLRRVATLKSSA